MKKYLSMLLFVLILGIIASGVLVGMDALTSDRIEANKEVDLRRTVLEAFEIPYKLSTINELFEAEVMLKELDGLRFYLSKDNKVGFVLEGSGVWGPIIGFIALDSELEEIQSIAVLAQQETPGLGGVVAEKGFLDQFKNIKVVPSLEINQDPGPNKDNEVDAITGATRTSKAFEDIINQEVARYKAVWVQE